MKIKKCIDCGKLISPNSIRCGRCNYLSYERNSKISKGLTGRRISQETKNKISQAQLGKPKWNTKQKIQISNRMLREKNQNWNGGKYIDKDGYVTILNPSHHLANKKGYVYEHKLVMEQKLGRKILRKEKIHHLDFNRSNNNIDNLYLFNSESQHKKYHIFLKNLVNSILKEINVI